MRRSEAGLPLPARRAAWDALWDKLLAPPRREPAEPEHVQTPEEAADPELRPRGEGGRP